MKKISSDVQLYETDMQFPYKSFTNHFIATQNHWHTEIEFIYVLSSCMDAHINGKYYTLKQGDLMFASGGDIHGNLYSDNIRLVFQFELDILESKYISHSEISEIRRILSSRERISYNWPKDVKDEIENILMTLRRLDENTERDVIYRLKITSLINQLVRTCCERIPESTDQSIKGQSVQSKKLLQTLEQVWGYVRDHYFEEIRLVDVAELLNYSPNHFTKVWKKYTGLSFHTYLNEYRINRAVSLLIESDLSISEIGLSVGFQSLKTFNRVFKSIIKTSPSEYRRRMKQKNHLL